MSFFRAFLQSPRFSGVSAHLRRAGFSLIAIVGFILFLGATGHAQGGVPLVTVATDQTPLDLSNTFGVPAATAINQAGDFAFIGNGNSALFFRASGASSIVRLLQVRDEVPGFPGSSILSFSPSLGLNSTKSIFFGVFFSLPDGQQHAALLTENGGVYQTVVSSDGVAPGSGGATYSTNLQVGGINDSGDVSFAAVPVGKTAQTYYVVPHGAPPVRVAATDDVPPPECTWCTHPTITVSSYSSASPAPNINERGQILVGFAGGLFIGSKDGLSLVPYASSGACQTSSSQNQLSGYPPVISFTSLTSILNISLGPASILTDSGTVVFEENTSSRSAICVVSNGSSTPFPVVMSANPAPASIGGGTLNSLTLEAVNNRGDIVLSAGISGGNTSHALFRYNSSSQTLDVIAYNGEVVPGPNGVTFASLQQTLQPPIGLPVTIPLSAFSAVSIASDGRVSFSAQTTQMGIAICQQKDAGLPILLTHDGQAAPVSGGGSFDLSSGTATITLDNGATFHSAYLNGGAGDFGAFLSSPTGVQALMSTADLLPSEAQVLFTTAAPKMAGQFVVFIAQSAGGRANLLETDLSAGVTRRIIRDGEIPLPRMFAWPNSSLVTSNFFVNENGQVAFSLQGGNAVVRVTGVTSFTGNKYSPTWSGLPLGCGGVYLWSPSAGLSNVAIPGDNAPIPGTTLSCATLVSGSSSPLSRNGFVVFNGQFVGPRNGNGVFLYSPGGTVDQISTIGDILPGQTQQTTVVPWLSVPLNSAGQVAFASQIGTPSTSILSFSSGFQGFFMRKPGETPQDVVFYGDPVPGSSDTFGAPHYFMGMDDAGAVTFTAPTSTVGEGIFSIQPGGNIQTIALHGGAAPGGGTFNLGSGVLPPPITSVSPSWPPLPTLPSLVPPFSNPFISNLAAMNAESDVVFRSGIDVGTADSGYFRRMKFGPSTGVLQPIVLQGQSLPGGGTLNTIPAPDTQGANFALDPAGRLAFVNSFTAASSTKTGLFVAHPDGTLAKVLVTGDTAPGGGNVTALAMSQGLAAGDSGKFAFLARVQGGIAHEAIFVTAIPSGTANTTTTVSSPQASPVFGQQVNLTATVGSATAGTSTGSVSFFDNGILLGSSALNATGLATLATSSLTTGVHPITAQYSGDTNFAPSNSSAFSETIIPRSTATAIVSSLNPAVGGQAVTFTATVTTSAGGPPTGTVTFLDNGASIGTGILDGSALATLNTAALSVAPHSIAARYEGDVNSATSTSSALSENLNVAGFAPPPANLAVTAGQNLVIPLTLYAAPGSGLSFTLSCTGLPANASCSFGSNPVSPVAPPNGTNVQLTLSTLAGSAAAPVEPGRGSWPTRMPGLIPLLATLLLTAIMMARQTYRRRMAFCVFLAVFAMALVMTGCSTGNSSSASPGTPRGPATFTVTGTSGATNVTTVVNVTVQ